MASPVCKFMITVKLTSFIFFADTENIQHVSLLLLLQTLNINLSGRKNYIFSGLFCVSSFHEMSGGTLPNLRPAIHSPKLSNYSR